MKSDFMATRGHEKYYNYIQFITTNVYLKVKIFVIPKYCQILLDNLDFYHKKYRFKLLGYVVMPDHCHFLILPNTKIGNVSQVMHDWKSYTAQVILKDIRLAGQGAPLPRGVGFTSPFVAQAPCLGKAKAPCLGKATIPNIQTLLQSGKLWQNRFDSFSIFSDQKFEEKLTYIHNNPIRAGLVKNLDDYPWSSYQNYYLDNNTLIEIDY